jgi:SET domain-containing protein
LGIFHHKFKAEIKRTRNGLGLFTKNKIKKNKLIFNVVGKTVKVSYEDDIEEDRWFGIGRETWLVVGKDNPMYYMNHSCNPNCVIVNKTQVVALRDIEPCEELTFDYSSTEEDPYWEMDCNCGFKSCRKQLRATASFLSEEKPKEIFVLRKRSKHLK